MSAKKTDRGIEAAKLAAQAAEWKQRQVLEQGQIVQTEAQALRFLLQENNLSRRLRRAMLLKWGGDPI